MRYIGSKLRLINFIQDTIGKYCRDSLHEKTFCDLFAGTGIVGRSFSPFVSKVIANDLEKYAYVANYVGLKGFDESVVAYHINKLNELEGTKDSTLFHAYSENGDCGRLYFSEENGKRLSAARKYLSEIQGTVGMKEYMAILFSIMDAADKVANTMATYGAYAKKLKANSLKKIEFVIPKIAKNASSNNLVYCSDANECIKYIKGDILYLDPPYNNRQYGSNYHVLNSIILGEAPETDSVTGMDKDFYNRSDYSITKSVEGALDELIANADFEWIFLSYNNEGLLSFDKIKSIMEKYGDYAIEKTPYQRYKADNERNQTADSVIEYIHVLHKGFFTGKINCFADTDEIISDEIPFEWDNIEEEEFCKGENGPQEIGNWKGDAGANRKFIPSPTNYMGGKKKLLPYLVKYFPSNVDNFIDLFCGGCSVGINADAKKVVFNDNLIPLIEMYKFMYTHDATECLNYVEKTIDNWGLVQDDFGKTAFQNFREAYNETPVEKRHPLDTFILMAYSFNNQIRFAVNKNWKFNVPFGKNRSSFNNKMKENFIEFINGLQARECVFTAQDFKDFDISQYEGTTFVYADPPYLISHATYNSGWNEDEEAALLNKLDEYNATGIKFALSNVFKNKGMENNLLMDWVKERGYNVIYLNKSYANSYYNRKNRDSETDEVLITNY